MTILLLVLTLMVLAAVDRIKSRRVLRLQDRPASVRTSAAGPEPAVLPR